MLAHLLRSFRLIDSTGTNLGEAIVDIRDILTEEETPFSASIELAAPLPEGYACQIVSLHYVGMPER
jgi:hypothetical protein